MSFKHILFSFSIVCLILLTACGNDTSPNTNQAGSINDGEKKSTETTQQDKQQQVEKETSLADQNNSTTNSTDELASKKQETTDEKQREEESTSTQSTNDANNLDKIEDGEGFSVVDGEVEAAKDVPKKQEQAILAAFEEYIAAFNAKDIARYENVLAQHPEGFDLQEDLKNSQQIFNNFDINRQVENVTITDYSEKRAYVYADIIVDVKQDNNEARDEGKQLTQFVKESSGWKVTSLQAIGNATNE